MKAPVVVLLALCAAVSALDWYVSGQFPAHEEHGYTLQDLSAINALVGRPDDLLALGRKNATAKAGRKYTKHEAAVLIAKIWNVGE